MSPEALQAYLHDQIPLSRAMAVEVLEASPDRVELTAPLAPNINMHGTMFGGSVATLALLAAWSVLHLRLEADGLPHQLVVHRTEAEYLAPITGWARAAANLEGADWQGFRHILDRRGRARLSITSELRSDEGIAARLTGEFVALEADRT